MDGDFNFKEDIVKVSDSAKDLIRKLLDPNPITRFSMSQAQGHPWLQVPANTAGSYIESYNSFLVTQGIALKPK
jgi:serine/threonine protein kinase